jgi:hypothetical protein
MRPVVHHLHVVSSGGGPPAPPASGPDLGRDGDPGDVALVAALFAIFFLPIVSVLAHVGRWSPGELGLGAAGSVFAGRALWSAARAALRDRRSS